MVIKPNPIESIESLRGRVLRMLASPSSARKQDLLSYCLIDYPCERPVTTHPSGSIVNFLDFMAAALPDGDIYLFGGVLRDLALLGQRGFASDIDLVVDGDWGGSLSYLQSLGATQNKFGGYRLHIGEWPIDIWRARDTWAIAKGLVNYKGVGSLTETTVLNWDAILMNWRTRLFVYPSTYLEELTSRTMDVVLKDNPNPLGMAVRAFRHLCLKDARRVTHKAAEYLAECAEKYTFTQIQAYELRSYGNSVIQPTIFRLFEHVGDEDSIPIHVRYRSASELMQKELGLI